MRKKKITELTLQQIDLLPVWRDKWIGIGLSTAPADRPAAEEAIRLMYRTAGIGHPKIVWCGSPLSQGLTRAVIINGASVWDSVGASVGASVWDSVRDSVRDSVWDSVRASMVRDDAANPWLPLAELATLGAYLYGVTDDGAAYVWRAETDHD